MDREVAGSGLGCLDGDGRGHRPLGGPGCSGKVPNGRSRNPVAKGRLSLDRAGHVTYAWCPTSPESSSQEAGWRDMNFPIGVNE